MNSQPLEYHLPHSHIPGTDDGAGGAFPGAQSLDSSMLRPGNQQIFNGSQMPAYQQIPMNPQMFNNSQMPSNLLMPSYYCPPVPRYQQIPSYQLMPGYQQMHGSSLHPSYPGVYGNPQIPGNLHSPNMAMRATPPINNPHYYPYQLPTPPEVPPGTEIIIALMGVTGAGKSYFIKEVTRNPKVEVSCDLHSCTSKVQPYTFEYAGAIITLVDTPGFNDTNRSDTEVLKEITDWTSATYQNNQLLSGIIYLHPVTHTRMEGSAMKNLRMFQSLCGQDVLTNVLLTTTHWSDVNLADGEYRENSLRKQDFWGGLISKGATLERFYGTKESGLELIHKLMLNTRKPLHIQDQIVNQHMTLLETSAGKCINEELNAQKEKFEKELESLKEQHQEAMERKDEEMKVILAAEREKAQKKLDKAAAEMVLLQQFHAAEIKRRDDEDRERREEAVRRERAVIAVATQDIKITAHFKNLFKSYRTKGRLIFDIKNHEDFRSHTLEVTIHYQPKFIGVIEACAKTFMEMYDEGMGETNYIVLDGAHYRCKSGTPIKMGGRDFVIFEKASTPIKTGEQDFGIFEKG